MTEMTVLEDLLDSADVRPVGRLDSLATPLLAIDAETTVANLQTMARYAAEYGLGLRPHIKTHKSRLFARLQLALGAAGLAAAKPSEALAVTPDAEDILLAYPAFTPERMTLIGELAQERRVRIAIDSVSAASSIATAAHQAGTEFGLLVDVDVGHHRTGVQSPDDAVALAKQIHEFAGTSFDGIQFFPGHLVPSKVDMDEAAAELSERVHGVVQALESENLPPGIVSGGSTPAARLSQRIDDLTEIRPGTYIFNDVNCIHWDCARLESCAAVVHATIVSTAVPGKAVMDAGSKMLTSDLCGAAPNSGFGLLVDHPQTRVVRLSEEHGEIELGQSDWSPRVGERVRVIPNHVCPCVNLQDELILRMPDDRCLAVKVNGRGCVR